MREGGNAFVDNLKVGDIVARKSYGMDILFKVASITNGEKGRVIVLKGITYRIEADAPETDLVLQPDYRIAEYTRKIDSMVNRKCSVICTNSSRGISKKMYYRSTPKEETRKFAKPVKVLHIDGDSDYLDTCLGQYKKFGIEAEGLSIAEKDQPGSIYKLLQDRKPDILILTGHDGMIKGDSNYNKLENYRNSKYFITAVKEARRYEADFDKLIIFAGACQSMYSNIISAGANYASAPDRVLIHALDPVLVCQKLANTGIDTVVQPNTVIRNTITGEKGIGGVQTRGKYRDGFPTDNYI